jgi:hypothetical protein
MVHLRIEEGSRPLTINQFAKDYNIIEAISDSNLDEDSMFHSGFNERKGDRNEENRS